VFKGTLKSCSGLVACFWFCLLAWVGFFPSSWWSVDPGVANNLSWPYIYFSEVSLGDPFAVSKLFVWTQGESWSWVESCSFRARLKWGIAANRIRTCWQWLLSKMQPARLEWSGEAVVEGRNAMEQCCWAVSSWAGISRETLPELRPVCCEPYLGAVGVSSCLWQYPHARAVGVRPGGFCA